MKKITFLLLFFCITSIANAQNLQDIVAQGKKAYIAFVDVKNNIPEAKSAIKNALLGNEWNRWIIVDSLENANFILKVLVEKKGMNIMSFKSSGARIRIRVEVLTLDNKKLWSSKLYQGNASLYTGFSALEDATNKMIRRALSDELLKQ